MHLTANEASRKASEVRILHPPQFYRDMEQQNTIENSVASAILEKSIDNIDIEGVTYEIAPPSTATLILISEIVATLPVVKKVPAEEIVTSVNSRCFCCGIPDAPNRRLAIWPHSR